MTDHLAAPAVFERLHVLAQHEARARTLLLGVGDAERRRHEALEARLDAVVAGLANLDDGAHWTTTASDGPAHHQRYRRMTVRVHEIVQNVVPAGAVVVVVSKGDDDLLEFEGREGWHFPQDERGVYAGYYPAESSQVIAHLQNLGAKGAGYFLLPSTGYWWLDHYAEFGQYLAHTYQRLWTDRHCVIYELSPTSRRTVHPDPPSTARFSGIRRLLSGRRSRRRGPR